MRNTTSLVIAMLVLTCIAKCTKESITAEIEDATKNKGVIHGYRI